MAYEQHEGGGSLFKNEYKTKDSHPDYKGSALINGAEMELAAWIKPGKEGKKPWMSINIQPKRERTTAPEGSKVSDEDLPF